MKNIVIYANIYKNFEKSKYFVCFFVKIQIFEKIKIIIIKKRENE